MVKVVIFIYTVVVLVASVLNEDLGRAQDLAERHPVSDFSRHRLVKPKIYHGREKRQISSSKENGEHLDHLHIKLEVDGEKMILDLTLNKQLIPKGFFHKHQENGTYKIHRPTTPQEVDLCQYNGKVRGIPDSWVALSTCDGLSGVIFDGKEMHYVERSSKGGIEDDHFLYKHSDLALHNKTCGYGGDAVDPEKVHEQHGHGHSRARRYKRQTDENEIVRGPYNSNRESKYVELVLVIDNREYKELGENKPKVLNHAKTIANIINGLYSPLNIFIALVGVVIWSENDEISFSLNGDTTLTNFLHYRREQLIKTHPNDNAQLLTKFNFENGVVGKALKGPICTYEFSGGVNTDHSPVVGLVATTVAHEMGHNFGMEHDTNECKCPDDRCIMAPSSSTVAPTHWSSCSLNYLLLAFTHGMDYCLKNKPQSLFDGPVCGNGFVEPGEECDCGLPERCENACCDANTCRLHANATCATGECCDLMTCHPKSAGTVCRSADYECDLPEYCTGESEYCPEDIYKLDTEDCDGGRAYCYHGFCRTRTDQCKLLWGETGRSSDDQCYMMNTKGTRHGNCGYDKLTQSYYKCDNESVLCGMLHCKHLNERLEFGMESVAILSHTFINKKGSIIPCRTALVDLGINQVDPGLTPDGALCGEGKMCVNQKCMSVLSLRRQRPGCPHDCNGNGWCNNKGHCHCRDGFAPPYCDYPGPGGSTDSGPASDPNARRGVITALFVIFLGVIPMLAIITLLTYYTRHNVKLGWKRSPPAMSKSPTKSRGPGFSTDTSKRTEDNHSLLHEDSPPPMGLQNNFFGHFKGFTITPAKKNEPEPVRVAPPPPVVSAPTPAITAPSSPKSELVKSSAVNRSNTSSSAKTLFNKPVQKYNSFRHNLSNGISAVNSTSAAPALPPLNPGSNPRPIISSPVLENSTCTAKELQSPLKNVPKVPIRAAPEVPKIERPLSTSEIISNTVLNVKIIEEEKKAQKDSGSGSTLNRIASFLKPGDKKPLTQTKPAQVKVTKTLDKDALRNIEISNPIPQTKIELPTTALPVDSETTKAVVMRAQSMRVGKDAPRPNIHTFGSMRQTSGNKRPLSIPSGVRPKNPPPPRPVETLEKKPDKELNQYDDCLNENVPATSPGSGDNIYAVIEESPVSPLSPAKDAANSGSSESMGLLGEIVSEIQNRNFDSIYSTSTLARKKKEEEEQKAKQRNKFVISPDTSETYVNTSALYPGSDYSDMSGNTKSSASTTSSGYILPSAVNVPVKKQESKEQKSAGTTLSTFKSDGTKPLSTFTKPAAPASSSKPASMKKVETSPDRNKPKTTPPSPTNKAAPKTAVSRQVTPPNLRARKASPTRSSPGAPKSNRSVTNSPDLVTSCNSTAAKQPDVLGTSATAKKPTVATVKPVVNNLPKVPGKTVPKSVSFKSPDKKSDKVEGSKTPVLTKLNKTTSDVGGKTSAGLRNAAKSNSTVASLQQKFENKNNVSSIKSSSVKAKT